MEGYMERFRIEYEQLCDRLEKLDAMLGVFTSERVIRSIIDSHMGSVRSGEISLKEFSNRVADCADIEVKNMHAGTLDRIVGSRGDAMWARVPVGESCEWRIMTGSLGYCCYSAQAAAKASHAKCNCLIVPKVGNKAPEIDGYDPDELYMRWVDGLKRECAENKCSQRKEREYMVSKNEVKWVEANPIVQIVNLLPNAKRQKITRNGKVGYAGSSELQVIIDALNGYFRIQMLGVKGDDAYRGLDGSIVSCEKIQELTHFKIRGFDV
ncbi:MAG: hypothetical protein PUE62_02550 [Coriobacteriaceae bacterium]|nr:hypothetical protein [Coriobacteriaceae bacterium]